MTQPLRGRPELCQITPQLATGAMAVMLKSRDAGNGFQMLTQSIHSHFFAALMPQSSGQRCVTLLH